MEARRALTLARAKHVQNNKDTITTIEQTETHKKTKEASTNDVDADDDDNNNKNNSMTTHPVVVAAILHDLKPDATTAAGATPPLACCIKNQYAKACVTAVATPRCPPRSSALFSKPSEGQSIGPRIVVTLPPVPAVPTTTAISVGKRGIGSCLSCNPG